MNLNQEILYLRKLYRRDDKILYTLSRKTQNNRVNLHWWSMRREDGAENVGDYLSVVIVEYMLKKMGLSLDTPISGRKHLYAVGSIIQGGAQNAVIWGSGLKHGTSDLGFLARKTRRLDVRLVRGPETQKALTECGFVCPEIYGDPAILMPLIYQPRVTEKKDHLIILNQESSKDIPGSIKPVTKDYKAFIDCVASARLVISSSLHGIILAEVYGVPAVMLADKVTEDPFKYNDYYYSTGRHQYPIAHSVEEGLKLRPPEIPDFEKLQRDIMSTFPYDLWQ